MIVKRLSNGVIKDMISFKISKDLYTKSVLLKTCFHFLDRYYLYLDANKDDYIIEINPKDSNEESVDIKGIFFNELIAQNTRFTILKETSDIRKLILARAFSSTMVDDAKLSEKNTSENVEVFSDWFENEN